MRRGEELRPIRPKATKERQPCGFPDCGRPAYAKGLCVSHRKQQLRGEELRPITRGVYDECLVEGCDRKPSSRGLCGTHRRQQQRGEDPGPIAIRGRRVCQFEGCDRRDVNRGLCDGHARQRRLAQELRPLHVPTYRYKHSPSGYILLKLPDHPNAAKNGMVMEHIKVMSDMLGRPLRKGETVHHINNNARDDNRPENLQLRQGKHGKGARFVCLDCGSHNVEAVQIG
jgi:hypothetical protein